MLSAQSDGPTGGGAERRLRHEAALWPTFDGPSSLSSGWTTGLMGSFRRVLAAGCQLRPRWGDADMRGSTKPAR
jgi:hypothetical protein